MITAKVKWFNDSKGYGFLEIPGNDKPIFVHYSAILGEGFKTLSEGQTVECKLRDGVRCLEALEVRKVLS